MRIALTERVLVDKGGIEFRMSSELEQLGIDPNLIGDQPPEGFKDCGVVTWNGEQYYMSTYEPPYVEGEE